MILVPPERIRHYVAQGWWGERTLGAIFLEVAASQPDRFAVADPPNRASIDGRPCLRWSWGDLLREVGAHAATLHAAGLRKDDVVVLYPPGGRLY